MEQFTKMYIMAATFMGSLKDRKGQTMVEYALLLALIAIIVIGMVTLIGTKTNNVYNKVATSLN